MTRHQEKDRKLELDGASPRIDAVSKRALDSEVEDQAREVLEHAVDAYRRDLDVYQSLQNLNEVIGTEYGDRVLYELLQNAHDAHPASGQGRIHVKLVVQSETQGVLYVANGGTGFRRKDVKAITNIAVSAKEIGEGIGNKGLGFRSIEALTDDVRIYSQREERQADHFEGYCFRFARESEIAGLIRSYGFDEFTAAEVARTVPRYLVPRSLPDQPNAVADLARRGYATVVVAPLRTRQAVRLATEQVRALADLEAPLLLFLDRLREVRIEAQLPNQKPWRRVRRRRQIRIGKVPQLPGCELHDVRVGEGRRFLVVRREVEKTRVLDAVDRSIDAAPQLRRWRQWNGDPVVSVAVDLTAGGAADGRLYNFLPMGKEALAPLLGYLDAPFFAEIDRRNADLDLPLNETLVEAAAEACAAAALHIVESGMPLPAQAVFDLVAWSGDRADALEGALQDLGAPMEEARIIPAIPVEGMAGWSSLSEISLWPTGKFSVFTPRAVARHVGAPLVAPELDDQRLRRLQEMACRVPPFRSLLPSGRQLARWAEAFAGSLVKRKVAPRTWSRFYGDLVRVYEQVDVDLNCLAGREILLDRSEKLRPAGADGPSSQGEVFVRRKVGKGRRTAEGVPLPPSTLTRRYRFLNEKIVLQRDALEAFVSAGLVREYDPVEALAGLQSALGRRVNSKRRTEALVWAFRVWQATGSAAEEVLRDADLHVPTLSGWRPASGTAFSSSWTSVGQSLENYLTEAAAVSPDCQRARERLLIGYEEWPSSTRDTKRRWIQFLDAVGVADGLRPIAAELDRRGSPAYLWEHVLRRGVPAAGLDDDWCTEAAHVSLNHPYTHYELRGEAWRLPGQLEHHELPETAEEALCRLVLEHLKIHSDSYFEFRLGRYDRVYRREWDESALPTPLAVFLRSKRWLAATSQGEISFCRPDECWASRARRGGPPRFLPRALEAIHDIVQNDELAVLVFGDPVGLRDWQSEATAVSRLVDLASVAPELGPSERPRFREEYRRAWADVTALDEDLPSNLKVAVARGEALETLAANPENPPAVIVTQDAQRFEVRVLSSAGRAVLDVGGDAPVEKVLALLAATQGFRPHSLDGVGVRLLVDGEPFVPSAEDPRLASSGLDWLPEVLVIAHELRGEQLERGVLTATVERKARAIRVRSCEAISLVVQDETVSPADALPFYAVEHEELPTLILPQSLPLNWRTLAQSLSAPISRLLDRRIRSLEPVLLRLAIDQPSEDLEAPSDEALARALDCDVATVREHRLAMRTDTGRVLHLLVPLAAYYGGVELARRLQVEVDRTGAPFDVREWVAANLVTEHSPDEVLHACERAGERAELRRRLGLDYAAFNRALAELGEPMLSNEEELRQLYGAYLGQMRPRIVERLRRHHVEDFRRGRGLQPYIERKA